MSSEDMDIDGEEEPLMQAVAVPNEAHEGNIMLEAITEIIREEQKLGASWLKTHDLFGNRRHQAQEALHFST